MSWSYKKEGLTSTKLYHSNRGNITPVWILICIPRCGIRTPFYFRCSRPGLSANVSIPWRLQPRARRRPFTYFGEKTEMQKRANAGHAHTNAGPPSCTASFLTGLPRRSLAFSFDPAPRWAPRYGRLCWLSLAVIFFSHSLESLLCFNAAGAARAADIRGGIRGFRVKPL